MKSIKVKYIGDATVPAPGTIGTAVKANGFYDPESAEHLAWVFFPDGISSRLMMTGRALVKTTFRESREPASSRS